MIKNVQEENKENRDFVENSNFIRGSTEAAVRDCSGVNLQENTLGRVHRTPSQVFSCEIFEHFPNDLYRTPLDGCF